MQAYLDGITSESGLSLLTRARISRGATLGPTFLSSLDELLPQGALYPEDVLELHGGPGSSKTYLVYFLCLTTCLPPKWMVGERVGGGGEPATAGGNTRPTMVPLGGRGASVAIMDCDGRFDPARVARLMYHHVVARVRQESASASVELIRALIRRCMRRIHIWRPRTTFELLATVKRLPAYFLEQGRGERFAMVVVDSGDAFQWFDRAEVEDEECAVQPPTEGKWPRKSAAQREVVPAFKQLLREWGLALVVTTRKIDAVDRRGYHPPSASAPGAAPASAPTSTSAPIPHPRLEDLEGVGVGAGGGIGWAPSGASDGAGVDLEYRSGEGANSMWNPLVKYRMVVARHSSGEEGTRFLGRLVKPPEDRVASWVVTQEGVYDA
ncbi:uncharacterized protein VTP21DRAFT_6974 [Calcarisporiella thermophila]|uniref:uncharacterized protein n=1 Tax=Calcarisporiella thermophila TaxID=911321 RepID=UPI003743D326